MDKPTRYVILDELGDPKLQIDTTRFDEITIRVAEELYHLYDHLNARLPHHVIDRENEPIKYERPGYEQDAMLYRFKLLAQVFPIKWEAFYKAVKSKSCIIKIVNTDSK